MIEHEAATLSWLITHHAAERYAKRINPQMNATEAHAYLTRHIVHATLQDERTLLGHERWLLPRGNAVVVAKTDLRLRALVAVTVLQPDEVYDSEAADEILAAYKRATAPLPPAPPPPPPGPTLEPIERVKARLHALYDDYNRRRGAHIGLRGAVDRVVSGELAATVRDLKQQLASSINQTNLWRERARSAEARLRMLQPDSQPAADVKPEANS